LVTEEDGTPPVKAVTRIVVSNGSLTVNGTVAHINTGGGGGGGTVNSGTANQITYYAGSGTAVSGLSTASADANFAMKVVSPNNFDSNGILVYANNLTQNAQLGWHGIAATSADFFIASGTSATFGDPFTITGSAGTLVSIDAHDNEFGLNHTFFSSTDGQFYVVNASAGRPTAVFQTAPSPSQPIAVFKNDSTTNFTVSQTGYLDTIRISAPSS